MNEDGLGAPNCPSDLVPMELDGEGDAGGGDAWSADS
jgi:hypothetical protein